MLDLLISPTPISGQVAKKAAPILERQGRSLLKRIEVGDRSLHLFGGEGDLARFVHEDGDGAFAVVCGTLIYRGQCEAAALKRLLEDTRAGTVERERLFGHFCVAMALEGRLYVVLDRLGTYHAHTAQDGALVSTSFLALCAVVERLSLTAQEVYEYVFRGAVYGGRTPFAEIGQFAPGQDAPKAFSAYYRPADNWDEGEAREGGESLERLVPEWCERLRPVFRDLVSAYPERLESSISGGYDSRLVLAGLLEQGGKPGLHVYGRSGDPDVVVARAVSAAAGLELRQEDKTTAPLPQGEAYSAKVRDHFFAFDGLPTDGIFDTGEDLRTRSAGMRDGRLLLNGAGGEIFRNFFYLNDGRFTAWDVVRTFYATFDPRAGGDPFKAERYLRGLERKLKTALGSDGGKMERWRVELAYPLFRGRYWTGVNIKQNNRLGSMAAPFFFPQLAFRSVRLPLAVKDCGRLEQRLIQAMNPALAAVPSDYGFSFDRPPTLKYRLNHWLTLKRPPVLRGYSYRLQARLRGHGDLPHTLVPEAVAAVLDDGFPWMRRYFRVEEVKDPDHVQRLCTLEYACQYFDAKMKLG